jgi:predicted membrane protein
MSDESQFDGKKYGDNLRDRIHQEIHQSMNARPWPRNRSGIIPGILLIVVGTIFLLDHMGFIQAEHFWKFWPLILIVVGLAKIFRDKAIILGIGFVLVGVVLQLHELNYTNLSWATIWPFLLIMAGAQMILAKFSGPTLPGISGSPVSDSTDMLNEYALFGGVERRVNIKNLRGGSISAIFGGVELDLRSAEIEGEEATVFVEATFGGVEIVVPDRWNVTSQIESIFAGYTDERTPPAPDPHNTSPRKTLILRGRAVFGGIVVKN